MHAPNGNGSAKKADPRPRAGARAERQIAHYLHRAFERVDGVHLLNGLRLVDERQPEHDGTPGVCQIDHLVVHCWGLFIVESKSVSEEVGVRRDASGGDEWTRMYRGKETGMASPIRQAARQSEFFRALLERHREQLAGKHPVGLRTASKLLWGTDQRGFADMPMQLIVAISDTGTIRRMNGWTEPEKPFPVLVTKADLVPEKIGRELKRHAKDSSLFALTRSDYGLWSMDAGEVGRVAEFLAKLHRGRRPAAHSGERAPGTSSSGASTRARSSGQAPNSGGKAACKRCDGTALAGMSGKYGYYWKCQTCGTNTTMPVVCSACGIDGRRDRNVRVRKERTRYVRDCQACGKSEEIWVERQVSTR